jgi:hypothetical protein
MVAVERKTRKKGSCGICEWFDGIFGVFEQELLWNLREFGVGLS